VGLIFDRLMRMDGSQEITRRTRTIEVCGLMAEDGRHVRSGYETVVHADAAFPFKSVLESEAFLIVACK